ncbi:hypothetical protein CBR_g36382 [Chara braunii]|uniref:Glycosyl transferase 48 domain-containing protein n=1 Tax=Chara braunii TaxID=69332 RepID=A0A388LKL5_CHABU|nr:hypothetical protein CBR_g36382 [Chara braunii]|eukprot:GBG82854.1 hypothetical protein CBR_g36382 [Chara braunii]
MSVCKSTAAVTCSSWFHCSSAVTRDLRSSKFRKVARGYAQLRDVIEGQVSAHDEETVTAESDGRIYQPASRFTPAKLQALADIKFTYVVTAQIYGQQKRKKEQQAEDISNLMKKYHALRIAYVDEVDSNFYSVLVKCNDRGIEQEIYRLRLPGQFRLGEGKPENQNHAVIFTRGEALQAIDMNQDNYLEEAFKMRNLLQEFLRYNGNRKPTILGVREHVFTSGVSSMAWFMSQQETSFVTMGQRTSANPLRVRMHYGHPDVFDRIFHMFRGGMSKASKTINLSEDIYAGFNSTLRGGNVSHHEYIQVGKGKDVGLNQIAMFEAKVSSGNGEQILSRDVYRLGHRLDFLRMLSFYCTSVGFFISNLITVWVVFIFLYGRVFMALSGVDKAENLTGDVLEKALNVVFIVQVGSFTALPLILEMALERGLTRAIVDFLRMQLQLCSVFYTFSLGTKAHYFGRTVLHGGAKGERDTSGQRAGTENRAVQTATRKLPAGEGAARRRSGRRNGGRAGGAAGGAGGRAGEAAGGMELVILLVALARYGNARAYILMTFSTWFMAFSFLYAPFFFNPSGLDLLKNGEDGSEFVKWLFRSAGAEKKDDRSWEAWWESEQEHLKSSGFFSKALDIVLDLRYFFMHYAAIYRLDVVGERRKIWVYLISWLVAIGVGFIVKLYTLNKKKFGVQKHLAYRFIQFTLTSTIILALVLLVVLTDLTISDVFVAILIFLPTGWGLIQIAQVLRPLVEGVGFWPTIKSIARLYDGLMGAIIIIPLILVSWLPIGDIHNRILFSQAFSQGLQIQKIIVGKRPNAKLS